MKTSEKGIELIKSFEGLRQFSYKCPAGVWTIGYGHTGGVKKGDTCTEEEAIELLKKDLEIFEHSIKDLVKVELNQNQFDALVSFVFNVGVGAFQDSTMRKFLNSKQFSAAAEQFDKWVHSKGVKLEGLVKRRAAEKNLFLSVQKSLKKYVVVANFLNVRQGPGVKYKIEKVLKLNTVVEILDTNGIWGKLTDGTGWVSLKYLEKI